MFFDDSTPTRRKKADKREGISQRDRIGASPVPPPKQYQLLTPDELFGGIERTFVFDTECYHNYWLAAFKCTTTGKIIFFEDSPDSVLNCQLLGFIMHRFRIVGFKSATYDMPMIAAAMSGCPAWRLKQISDEIIREDKRPWQVEKDYGVRIPDSNHIDLIEVAPISASLKIYAGRLGCERMQDLPYDPDKYLDKHEAINVRDYCVNDLDDTHLLWDHLAPHIELRQILGAEYGQDLRSKSDAQVAETIIQTELERIGAVQAKPKVEIGSSFYYEVPSYIRFRTAEFQHALDVVRATPFTIGNGGSAECPPAIAALKPRLGSGIYRLGVGGLHSSEENSAHMADADTLIIDRDVASYYPRIILNNRLFPPHLGEAFLEVYESIVTRRLKLKKEKNPLEAGLKIAINGIFGKLGNIYSAVYAPHLLLQVCMTGQLSLMMLIEAIELAGISVISANTDGIVIKCAKRDYDKLMGVITEWERITRFETEETRYEGIYGRDVNNYYAAKTKNEYDKATDTIIWYDGVIDGIKTKGVYSEKGSAQNSVLSKNPECYVTSMAVQEFLTKGVPIAETIYNCKDMRRFVAVRSVKGGGAKDGIFLGKAIRWYYAVEERGTINYVISGNKVPKTEGARPLMILPNSFPNDIDYDKYINLANETLFDIGYYKRLQRPTLFG